MKFNIFPDRKFFSKYYQIVKKSLCQRRYRKVAERNGRGTTIPLLLDQCLCSTAGNNIQQHVAVNSRSLGCFLFLLEIIE